MARPVDDFCLPKATVARIIKAALPKGVTVSAETASAVGRSATIFIISVAATAQQVHRSGHITENMVLNTVELMGFPEFVEPLMAFSNELLQKSKQKKIRNKVNKNIGQGSDAVPVDSKIDINTEVILKSNSE